MSYIVDEIKDTKTTTQPLGTITEGTLLTVSDPCYLDDYYDIASGLSYEDNHNASVSGKRMAGGEWQAYAVTGNMGEGGLGGIRVIRSGIELLGKPRTNDATEALQGVDAGMVGYFIGTPSLSYEESYEGLRQMHLIERPDGKAWITSSGFGDGGYLVNIYWDDDQITGVEVTFIIDEEEAAHLKLDTETDA